MADVKLKITDLKKNFASKVILDNLNFEVNHGEFLSIVGPSGCGKTTLLRILIGLEPCDSGRVFKGFLYRRYCKCKFTLCWTHHELLCISL